MDKSRTRSTARLIALASAVGLLVALGVAGPALGDPVPDDKGAANAPPPPTGRACAERSGPGAGGRGEFASCVGVTAALDKVPAVGGTATLTVTVRAAVPLPPAEVRIALPAQFTWAAAPAGFGTGKETSALPENPGTITTATRTVPLVVGKPSTFTAQVKAVAAGFGDIVVRATAPDGRNVQAGQDHVAVTVAEAGKVSRFGADRPVERRTVAVPRPDLEPGTPSGRPPISLAAPGPGANILIPTDPPPPVPKPCFRVSGDLVYADVYNKWHGSANVLILINGVTQGTIFSGLTNADGHFDFCVPYRANLQLFASVRAANGYWSVRDDFNSVYQWSTPVAAVNPAPGASINLGSLGVGIDNRILRAYAAAYDAYLTVPHPTNPCWDQHDSTCRELIMQWASYLGSGDHDTFYDPATKRVTLGADSPDSPVVVAHEIGHFLMDDIYNDNMPVSNCPDLHYIEQSFNATCAWVEGFADWFALIVNREKRFVWPNGSVVDLENATWGNGWGESDITEARVAGAMLDLVDNTDSEVYDHYTEPYTVLWETFVRHPVSTFRNFWTARGTFDHFDTTSPALSALYESTIDFGFIEPLGNYQSLYRLHPTVPRNYRYNTTTYYWSVIAVRPDYGTDIDLSLFDDQARTAFLSNSIMSQHRTDFVAIDSNYRPLGDYYPQAYLYNGPGGYDIELAQGQEILGASSATTISMHWYNTAHVMDTWLVQGVPVTFTLTPQNSQQMDLLLMFSDPATPATWIQRRGNAVASSLSGLTEYGKVHTLTYTPTRTGWYGVVVTNQSGGATEPEPGQLTLART